MCVSSRSNPCRIKVKAHGGFMRVTAIPDAGKETLVKQIKDALLTSRSNATFVTGHSLGGAMAVITSGMVQMRYLIIRYNVTL